LLPKPHFGGNFNEKSFPNFFIFSILISFGRAPGYLADELRLAGRGRPGLRSAASMMLDIPRTTTSLGDRAFAVAGPRVWNSLPTAICDPSLSLSVFGKLLKTYLFFKGRGASDL